MMTSEIDRFIKSMESWESSIGLPKDGSDFSEVSSIINMSGEEVAALTSQEAANKAFVLSQVALSVQRGYNRCTSFIRWARASSNPENKTELSNFIETANQRMDRISFLTRRLETMSDALISVQRSRYYQEVRK